MRVVVDVMGAPDRSGGMQLYASELVRSWAELFPDDALHVLGGEWIQAEFAAHDNVRIHSIGPTSFASRAFQQLVGAGLLFRRVRAESLISVSTIVSPLAPRRRRICVIHDWRHLRLPGEFGRGQLLYRRLWPWSARMARAVVTISAKTDAETAEVVPRAHRVLIQNGADHPRRWGLDGIAEAEPRTIVTFGHHANKRPQLVIDALSRLPAGMHDVRLVVLGAQGQLKAALERHAAELGVVSRCSFPGFVDAERYQRLVAQAAVVVLASSDEGFGLPVAEAKYFGIPVVGATDSGLDEIFGDQVQLAPPAPDAFAEAIADGLTAGRGARVALRRTWGDVARELRALAADRSA